MGRIPEEVLLALAMSNSGGGGGTANYNDLENKPKIAGTTLSGNKSLEDLGIASATDLSTLSGTVADKVDKVQGKGLSTNDYDNTAKGIVDGVTSALADKVDKVAGKGLSTNDYTDADAAIVAGVTTALAGKQDTLTFDSVPTDGSTNPVESNGVYDALATKANASDVTTALALKQDATDNNLTTTSKTVVGGINELKSGLTTLDNEVNGDSTTYPYADVITIEDAIPANVADCNVKIEPVQDLHGYDKPWVGGAGKNKLPLVLADLKTANTDGTWNDNVYTINNGTITVYTDDGGNVTSIKANGTFNASTNFFLKGYWNYPTNTDFILNGCPSDGSSSTYNIQWWIAGVGSNVDSGSGVSVSTPSEFANNNVLINIASGQTMTNAMFYPMIRLATETDATFAPYTNICPISGHTEASVEDVSGNLANNNGVDTTNGYIANAYLGSDGATNSNNNWFVSEYFAVPKDDITISGLEYGSSPAICFYDASKNYISGVAYADTFPKTVTVPSNAKYARASIPLVSKTTANVTYKHTATIALGDTIYGGTVDFDSGVMTVTRVKTTVDDLEWTKYNVDQGTLFRGVLANIKQVADGYELTSAISSAYPAVANNDRTDKTLSQGPMISAVDIIDDDYADAASFKTAMSDVEICYELATPTTIQLTPQQIQLLKGTNTLTASTGQISVTVNGVSGSIGALTADKQDKTDYALETTAKTVVGAINEVNGNLNGVMSGKLGMFTDIKSYTTVENRYTFPSDGYVASVMTNTDIICRLYSSDVSDDSIYIDTKLSVGTVLYVRKGMRTYITTNSDNEFVLFIPFV